MTKEEKLEDIIEVEKKEYLNGIYTALKQCKAGKQKIENQEAALIQSLNDITIYESLGYNIQYIWNEKNKTYSYNMYDKETIGFKPVNLKDYSNGKEEQ